MRHTTPFNQLHQHHHIPTILSCVCALLLLLTISNTIIAIATHHIKTILLKTQPVQPLDNIANLHLFGVFSANLDNLPATILPLKLSGTVVSLNSVTPSYALITVNQDTKVYKVGDSLPDNAKITHITKRFVILDDNGTSEKLALPIKILNS